MLLFFLKKLFGINYSFNSELFIFSKFEIEFYIDEKTSF